MHLLPQGCRSNCRKPFAEAGINNHHLSRVCVDAYVVCFNVLGPVTAKGEESSGKKLVFSFLSRLTRLTRDYAAPHQFFATTVLLSMGAKYE